MIALDLLLDVVEAWSEMAVAVAAHGAPPFATPFRFFWVIEKTSYWGLWGQYHAGRNDLQLEVFGPKWEHVLKEGIDKPTG